MGSSGDIQNFNNLFNKHYENFVCFAMSYVKDRPIAEDIVSEAFTAFWENQAQLLPSTKPQAYILTVIKNKCLNHLRHLQVRQRAEKEINEHAEWKLSTSINTLQACDPSFLFSEEVQLLIESTLNDLPKKTRQIFILNRYGGFSYKEIASRMKLSPKSVEFHISKALKHLRISLEDFLGFVFLFFYF